MTGTELNARIAKFKSRVPQITSQTHIEKIIGSFPVEHRPLVISEIGDMLGGRLIAREPVKLEVKPKDPDNPAAQEATAIRLNAQNAKILEQDQAIKELQAGIIGLQVENAELKGLLDKTTAELRSGPSQGS